jgi:hypothetical protein
VTSEQADQNEANGRVIFFPRRSWQRKRRAFATRRRPGNDPATVGDLSHFEQGDGIDDYARRMVVNALAFAFIVMLTVAGLWIAERMAQLRKNEDCALSGRRDCADLGLAAHQR